MDRSLKIHVVDDDPQIRDTVKQALEMTGHQVRTSPAGDVGLDDMLSNPPDVAIIDLMMPGLNGVELCRQMRARPELASVPVIVLSAKIYDADKQAALAAGASAYATKPIRMGNLNGLIQKIMANEFQIEFWGVRGTLPAPAPENVRYGGNTSCTLLRFPGDRLAVLDAGTGIRPLGMNLLKTQPGRLDAAIFITHPHWDHINALPFFAPLFIPGNRFEILGPAQLGHTMKELVAAQMDGTFFPITPREFGSDISYRDLIQGPFETMGIKGEAMMLMHPGVCLGYRFDEGDRKVAYITDNEMYLPDSAQYTEEYVQRLTKYLEGVDVLMIDATYFDEEYPSKVGWGHTNLSQVAKLAHEAGVKRLCLHHHDPAQTDDDIDRKLEFVSEWLAAHGSSTIALAPRERETLIV